LLGLDFVTGERVLPAWLLRGRSGAMQRLPRWGAEIFINRLTIEAGLRVAVVDWPGVRNVRKYEKAGVLAGLLAEVGMIGDALRVVSPGGLVAQNLRLLALTRARPSRPGRDRRRPSWNWRLLSPPRETAMKTVERKRRWA